MLLRSKCALASLTADIQNMFGCLLVSRPFTNTKEEMWNGFDDQVPDDKSILASPKRVHDMLYITLGVSPPPSWKSGGGDSRRVPPSGGATKRANLGPTDTNSLQELLIGSGDAGLDEVGLPPTSSEDKKRDDLWYLVPALSLSGLGGS